MKKIYLFLTTAGVLFSGYLSGVKFFTKTCAFGEGCPYFLGYPACYYGFVMFLSMFVLTLVSINKNSEVRLLSKQLVLVSLLGICFSGYFVFLENFGLTTCAFGLIFYILIFIISLKNFLKS